MKLTLEKLVDTAARIAACGHHKSREALAMAIEMWEEAEDAMEVQKKKEARAWEDLDVIGAPLTAAGWFTETAKKHSGRIPFGKFLKHCVPGSRRNIRLDRVRAFLRARMGKAFSQQKGRTQKIKIEDGVRSRLDSIEKDGLAVEDAKNPSKQFSQWWPKEEARRQRAKSSKGGETGSFAITPSLQLILDPASNPAEDLLVVGGLRARVVF